MRPLSAGISALVVSVTLSMAGAGCGPDQCGGLACLDDIAGLAADGQYVYYFTAWGTLGRMAKEGGDPEQLTSVGGQSWHVGLTRSGRELFWIANDKMMRASVDGGPAVELASAVDHFAVDAENVYVFAWSDDPNAPGRILKVSRQGGAPEVLVQAARVQFALAAGGGYLYYDSMQGDFGEDLTLDLRRVPIAGGAPEVAVDAFASSVFADVQRLLFCGTGERLNVFEQGQLRTFERYCPRLVDGDQLFGYRNYDQPSSGEGHSPEIWSATVGRVERTLASAGRAVSAIALDAEYVYYADKEQYKERGLFQWGSRWRGRISRVHR